MPRFLDDSVPARLFDLLVDDSGLAALLYGIAQLSPQTVPGCSFASITVVERDKPSTIAASAASALAIDEAQYHDGDGPCVRATYTGQVMWISDLSHRPRTHLPKLTWPEVALSCGVTAVISLPIDSESNIAASLNLYTTDDRGWPESALTAAKAVTAYAGDVISLAYRMTHPRSDRSRNWPDLK
jgi:hypothetical protein